MAFVQAISANAVGASSVTTAGITTNAGSFIPVGLSTDTSHTISGTLISDSKANSYTAQLGPINSGTGSVARGYLYWNNGGTRGASHTFTAAINTTGSPSVQVAEFSGRATSTPIDASQSGNDGASGVTSHTGPSIVTTTAGDDIWSFHAEDLASGTQGYTAGTNWTIPANGTQPNASNYSTSFQQYQQNKAASTYADTWTTTAASQNAALIIAIAAAAGGGVSGSAAITESADTAAGVGTDKVSGTAAITEGTDTAAGVGAVAVSGTAAIAEGIDTAAGVGVVAVSGAAAITEGLDTGSGIGTVAVSGTAAILEGQDIVAGIGGDAVSGTVGITEGIDTASGVGVSGAGGFASITEGTDTAAGTGVVAVTGSAAILEGADTVLGSGAVESDGAAAITESADTVSASGTAASSGTGVAAIFEDGDIVVAAGGAIAITQDTHDPKPWIKRKKRFDDSAQTQVIRESQLKPKKPKRPAKESTAEPVAPKFDAGPEDEEIMLLVDDEDARTADLIELATQILRTLH